MVAAIDETPRGAAGGAVSHEGLGFEESIREFGAKHAGYISGVASGTRKFQYIAKADATGLDERGLKIVDIVSQYLSRVGVVKYLESLGLVEKDEALSRLAHILVKFGPPLSDQEKERLGQLTWIPSSLKAAIGAPPPGYGIDMSALNLSILARAVREKLHEVRHSCLSVYPRYQSLLAIPSGCEDKEVVFRAIQALGAEAFYAMFKDPKASPGELGIFLSTLRELELPFTS